MREPGPCTPARGASAWRPRRVPPLPPCSLAAGLCCRHPGHYPTQRAPQPARPLPSKQARTRLVVGQERALLGCGQNVAHAARVLGSLARALQRAHDHRILNDIIYLLVGGGLAASNVQGRGRGLAGGQSVGRNCRAGRAVDRASLAACVQPAACMHCCIPTSRQAVHTNSGPSPAGAHRSTLQAAPRLSSRREAPTAASGKRRAAPLRSGAPSRALAWLASMAARC